MIPNAAVNQVALPGTDGFRSGLHYILPVVVLCLGTDGGIVLRRGLVGILGDLLYGFIFDPTGR